MLLVVLDAGINERAGDRGRTAGHAAVI